MSRSINPAMVAAIVRRVLRQLRHDPRTIGLALVVPPVLMTLLRYVFDSRQLFDTLAPALLGTFPLLMMFLLTSVTMQRERSRGTLERLLTLPMAKIDLLVGYAIAFSVLATAQVLVTLAVSLRLGFHVHGSLALLVLVAVLNAWLGVALGLLASAFARTEFQAVQFMPVVVLPQLILCGLLAPRGDMLRALSLASDVMPLSYAVEALQQVARHTASTGTYWRDTAVLLGCVLAALAASAATLRRRTH